MKKYGLELRVPPSQQKKQPTRPRPPLAGFRDDDDEDDAAERAVSQQTIRSRALKEIEEQQQKALEEDPTIFDYDGVYDKLKQEVARPRALDREERKPKYIMSLKKSVERRQREHEIIYERQIAKERSKDDHLYADKDKFVTSAYKRKLAEQDKWKEEERLRELREEKEDVTKKSDLSDFYFNLSKNVAFGSRGFESKKPEKHPESSKPAEKKEEVAPDAPEGSGHISPGPSSRVKPSRAREANKPDVPAAPKIEPENKPQVYPAPRIEPADAKHVPDVPSSQQKDSTEPPPSDQPKGNHHKRSEDAVAAAKERFLARKRAKESL
ncbi:nuclear speckle splicing regulatory protein 1-like [Punica granatum]|nr:nuclear speckle splicing regulatory protein 1-like [Punica granatum]